MVAERRRAGSRRRGVSVPSREEAKRIPVLLCVDVEPDEFYVDRRNPQPWRGFEAVDIYFRDVRTKLEEKTGNDVHFCWAIRMDPQVALAYGSPAWVAERYGKLFEEYRRAGDELGSHVHTYRWSEQADTWIDDVADETWTAHCLETSSSAHVDAFGEPARTVRFGVFWSSTAVVNRAEDLGYRYDLTVEPGLPPEMKDPRKPFATDLIPGYYRVPREPYTPSRSDFLAPARNEQREMTIIPLTSAYKKLGLGVRSSLRRLERLRNNGFRNRLRSLPLSMWREWSGENDYGSMLSRALALQRKPYLAFVIHSNFPVTESYERVHSSMEALMAHPDCSRFLFCTPGELLRELE